MNINDLSNALTNGIPITASTTACNITPGYVTNGYVSTSPYTIAEDPFDTSKIHNLERLVDMMNRTEDTMVKTRLKELVLILMDSMYPKES